IKMQQRKMSRDMNVHSKSFLLPTRFSFHRVTPHSPFFTYPGYIMLYAL
uniref:Uncharacterized protein n=1 Tax=Aegilops tauschii subsp. strangulata TaxID=200361 RepID=A0A452ZJ32_AEGTS